jgi:hypothetical protein
MLRHAVDTPRDAPGENNFDTEQLPFSPAPVTLMVDVFTGLTPRQTSGATMNPREEFEAPQSSAGTHRRARPGARP